MSAIQAFGGPGRYYADTQIAPALHSSAPEAPYAAAFAPVAQDLEEAVSEVLREFNLVAREALRAETGLKLKFQGRKQSVRIYVVPGLPQPLDAVAKAQPDPSVWAIFLHRALFETTRNGLTTLLSEWNLLMPPAQRVLPGHQEVPVNDGRDEVHRAKLVLDMLLDKAKATELREKLRNLNQDVLGAYFFRRGEIHLYWMAIGLFAGVIGRPVRELVLITLLHELAHAYTHLGLDIDSLEWKTQEFADADFRIVEGLAQFYTEAAMDRLYPRGGDLSATFDALIPFQSDVYSCHRAWAEDAHSRGEIVRLGMVTARKHGTKSYDEFLGRLAHAGGMLEADGA